MAKGKTKTKSKAKSKAKSRTTRVPASTRRVRFQSIPEPSSSPDSSASVSPIAASKTTALRTPVVKESNEADSDSDHEATQKQKEGKKVIATRRRGRALLVTPLANVGILNGVPEPKTPGRKKKRVSVAGIVFPERSRNSKGGSPIKRRASDSVVAGVKELQDAKSQCGGKAQDTNERELPDDEDSDGGENIIFNDTKNFLKYPVLEQEKEQDVSDIELETPTRPSRKAVKKLDPTPKPATQKKTYGAGRFTKQTVQNRDSNRTATLRSSTVNDKSQVITNSNKGISTTNSKDQASTFAPDSSTATPIFSPRRTRQSAKRAPAEAKNLTFQDMSEDPATTPTYTTTKYPKRESATITPVVAPVSLIDTATTTRKRSAASASILTEATHSSKKTTPAATARNTEVILPATTPSSQAKTGGTAQRRKTKGWGARKQNTASRGRGKNTHKEGKEETNEDLEEDVSGDATDALDGKLWLSCLRVPVDNNFPREQYDILSDDEL